MKEKNSSLGGPAEALVTGASHLVKPALPLGLSLLLEDVIKRSSFILITYELGENENSFLSDESFDTTARE